MIFNYTDRKNKIYREREREREREKEREREGRIEGIEGKKERKVERKRYLCMYFLTDHARLFTYMYMMNDTSFIFDKRCLHKIYLVIRARSKFIKQPQKKLSLTLIKYLLITIS